MLIPAHPLLAVSTMFVAIAIIVAIGIGLVLTYQYGRRG